MAIVLVQLYTVGGLGANGEKQVGLCAGTKPGFHKKGKLRGRIVLSLPLWSAGWGGDT